MNLNGLNWAPSFPTTCTSQKRIQHIKWQILNWKLEFFRKWEALPLGFPWIFSKITATFLPTKTYKAWHATKQNQVYQVSMRLSSTGNNLPKKGRTKIKRWQNSIWQNMNQWANVSLKYSSCFQSRLQEATTIIEIWFGYVWLFHNETSKDLLHAQQHLKTWVLLQKGVALPSENESNKQVRCVVYRWPC